MAYLGRFVCLLTITKNTEALTAVGRTPKTVGISSDYQNPLFRIPVLRKSEIRINAPQISPTARTFFGVLHVFRTPPQLGNKLFHVSDNYH